MFLYVLYIKPSLLSPNGGFYGITWPPSGGDVKLFGHGQSADLCGLPSGNASIKVSVNAT